MKKDIKEICAEISGKVKATATRLWDKVKSLSRVAKEKARELFLKAKAKISKWASVLEERLATIAPKVDIKVKKGILIALVALIALGIAFSITVNAYAKDTHVFVDDKCENCGISSSLVYKFEYISETDSYSVSGRDIWRKKYDHVILPETYKGKPVSEVAPYAFDYAKRLTKVEIPESVTTIGRGAFLASARLSEVVFSEGLTLIDQEAFGACSRLDNLSFPETLLTVGHGAFFNCTGISAITIPDSVATIDNHAFEGCKAMKSLKIGASVSYIGNMAFAFCDLDTVTGESQSFYTQGDTLIEKESGIVFVGTNNSVVPEGATAIGNYAFSCRTTLAELILPASVKEIGTYAFYDCDGIKTASLGGVVSIGQRAFYSTTLLSELTLPETLEIIGEEAFANCASLAKLTIPDSVTTIGVKAFLNCESLTEIYVGSGVNYIGAKAFLFCVNITKMDFADTNGWYVSKTEDTLGDLVSSEELGKAEECHAFFTMKYKTHFWKKNP